MFSIQSITILKDCKSQIRKNLKVGVPYAFQGGLPEGFYEKNISVYAIVGKNGSGKSTLLEIMYRLINNLGYCMRDITMMDYNICYCVDLSAVMQWTMDGKQGMLKCQNQTLELWYDDVLIFERQISRKTAYNYLRPAKLPVEWENKAIEIARNFFYTVAVNYSIHAFISQDYKDEKVICNRSFGSIKRVDRVWCENLFHKNDRYFIPITLNPQRTSGKIDVNRDMTLARDRVLLLLLYFKSCDINYIEGYDLSSVRYSFSVEKVLDYFTENELDSLCARFHIDPYSKKIYRLTAWKQAMEKALYDALHSKSSNILRFVCEAYGIDQPFEDDVFRYTVLYLACKVVHIGCTYPGYQEMREFTKPNMMDIFSPSWNEASSLKWLERIVDMLKADHSHVSWKVARTVNFLKRYQRARNIVSHRTDDQFTFDLDSFMRDVYGSIGSVYSFKLEEWEQILPPSVFIPKVYLTKSSEKDRKEIELNQMSSGERQFLFSTSTIMYHLVNLYSVDNGAVKYHCFNIVIDEVEICFHPEYQRTFVDNLLTMLNRLDLNKGENRINIILTTHSPFILSDIPSCNILYLKEGAPVHPDFESFGANIYDLLKNQFFMGNTMGKRAAKKIAGLVDCYFLENEEERRSTFSRCREEWAHLLTVANNEGIHAVLQMYFDEMDKRYNKLQFLMSQKAILERQIEELGGDSL